jgi:Flp pilus assembly protein TadD
MGYSGHSREELVKAVSLVIVILPFFASVCYGMSALGHAVKGKECVERGGCDEAIDHFTQAIATGGFDSRNLASLYNNRGIAYSMRKDYDKALDDFTMAMKVDPSSALPAYNMACLHSLMKKPEESCSWLRKAIEMGYDDWSRIKADATLDNIRDLPCYKEVTAGKQ